MMVKVLAKTEKDVHSEPRTVFLFGVPIVQVRIGGSLGIPGLGQSASQKIILI